MHLPLIHRPDLYRALDEVLPGDHGSAADEQEQKSETAKLPHAFFLLEFGQPVGQA